MPLFSVAVVDRFDFELDQKFVKAPSWRVALIKFEHRKNEKTNNCPDMSKWIEQIPSDKKEALEYYSDTDRTFSVKKVKV